jgi:c-di-GMP-binding flagellar brake protein YcgR
MAGKTGWMEKRQHERVVATLKIGYRLIESKDAKKVLAEDSYRTTTADQLPGLAQVSPIYEAVTKDISAGGLCIVSEQQAPLGTVLEVSLTLPNYQTSLKFLAEVVRVDQLSEMGRTLQRWGVKTLAINKEDVTRMEAYLIEKMRKK